MCLGGLRNFHDRKWRLWIWWNEFWTNRLLHLSELISFTWYLLDAYPGSRPVLGARTITVTKTDTVPTLTELSKKDRDKTSSCNKVKKSSEQGVCLGVGNDSDLPGVINKATLRNWRLHSYLFFNWSIITLQCRVSFCSTTMWISCMYTCIASPPCWASLPLTAPHPTPLGHYKLSEAYIETGRWAELASARGRRAKSALSRGNNIRRDPGVGSSPGGWSQEKLGGAVKDEADEDDRGQTVDLNLILEAKGSHRRILGN